MRGSGAIDADQCVAVAAFVVEGQVSVERRPSVALGHDHRPGRQHGGEGLRQRGREALRMTVWRVEEHQIVLGAAARCRVEEAQGVGAATSAVAPSACRLAWMALIAGCASSTKTSRWPPRARALRGRARPSRRTGPGPGAGTRAPRIENSASRTRSDVGRVASPGGAFSVRPRWVPAITRIRVAAMMPSPGCPSARSATSTSPCRSSIRRSGR